MSGAFEKTRKFSAWAVVAAACIVGLVLTVLQTPWAKRRIRDAIVDQTNASIEGELEIRRVSGSLLWSATLEGVRLADGRGRPIANIRRVRASYSPISLLWGHLELDSVTVERPRVLVRRYPDGTPNLSTLVGEREEAEVEEPSDFAITVESYRLEGGRIAMQDASGSPSHLDHEALSPLLDELTTTGSPSEPLEKLRGRLAEVEAEPTSVPSFILATDLQLEGAAQLQGTTRLDHVLDSMSVGVETETLPRRLKVSLSEVTTTYDAGRAELALESFAIEQGVEVTDLDARVAPPADPEKGGLPEWVHARVGGVELQPEFVSLFIPGGRLTAPISTELEVGGRPKHLWASTSTTFGDAGAAETAASIAQSDEGFEYRIATQLDEFEPRGVLAIDGFDLPPGTIRAALRASGSGLDPETASASLDAVVWKSQVGSLRIHSMRSKAALDSGTVRLEKFAVDSSHVDARARAEASLDGTFELEARSRTAPGGISSEDVGLDSLLSFSVGRANSSIDLSGRVDPGATSAAELVRHVDGGVRWDVAGIRVREYRLDQSAGSADFALELPEGTSDGRREFRIRSDASGGGVALPGLTVGSFRIDGSAEGTVRADFDRPMHAVTRLKSSWSGRVRAVRARDLSVDSADFDASLSTGDAAGRFDGSVEADVSGIRRRNASIASVRGSWRGGATIDPNANYLLGSFEVTGTSTVTGVAAASATVERVESDVDLEGAPLDPVGQLQTRLVGVEASGRRLESADIDVEAMSERRVGVVARATPEAEDDTPYRVDATFGYNRQFDSLQLSAFEGGRGAQIWTLADEATVSLLPRGIGIGNLEIRNGEQKVQIDGEVRLAGRQNLDLNVVQLDLEGLQDLTGFRPIPKLVGQIDVTLALSGTSSEPALTLGVKGRKLEAVGYGPGSFDVEVRTEPGWVVLEKATASVADHQIGTAHARLPLDWNLSGDWSYHASADTEVALKLNETTIDALARAAPQIEHLPLNGQVGGLFEFSGPLDRPSVDSGFFVRNFSIHGDIAGTRIDVDDINSETSLHFGRASKADRRLDFESSVEWRGERVFSVSLATDAHLVEWGIDYSNGSVSLMDLAYRLAREPIAFSAVAEKTDLSQLPLETLKKASAEGIVSGKVTFDGTLFEPDARARMDVEDFGWNQIRDIFVETRTEFRSDALTVEQFRFEWDADEILTARGTLPVPISALAQGKPIANAPMDFTVQLNRMSLMKLGAVDYSFNKFKGNIAGYVHLTGTLANPKLDARAALNDALFSKRQRGSLATWLHADTTGVKGGTLFCQDSNPILTAQYEFPLNLDPIHLVAGGELLRDGPVSATVKGSNIPLAQLVPTPFVETWVKDPEGYLQVDLALSGTWEDLTPSGAVALEEGGATVVPYSRRFQHTEMRATFDGDRLVLENFHLEDNNDGVVDASGHVVLTQLVPGTFELHAETQTFEVGSMTVGFPALLTSNTDLSGEFRADRHDIKVETNSLEVEMPETDESGAYPTALSDDVIIIQKYEKDKTNRIDAILSRGSKLAELLDAKVDITVSRDSYVRHPNGTLQFSADMDADLRGTNLRLTGRVDAVEGKFEFLGKTFNVDEREGIVRFTGAESPNPRLDVVAVHPLDRSVVAQLDPAARDKPRVFVRVSGTVYEPKLDMTSEPSMSESEIVYVLMTGRPPSNAEVGQEEGVASKAAAAAGGIFSALIQQKISKTVPIDMLRFESGESGLQGSKVRVGKYIGKGLFVSSAYQFGANDDKGGWETRVEWHFAPRWMVEAVYGDEQTGTLNTFWDIY